jgi:hypothetical protein
VGGVKTWVEGQLETAADGRKQQVLQFFIRLVEISL